MDALSVIALALPVASAVPSLVLGRTRARGAARASIAAVAASLLLWCALLLRHLVTGALPPPSLDGHVLPLLLDPLGLALALVISGISLVVHVYALNYMADEPGYGRFFGLLDLMTAALLLLVTSGDLIILIAAWLLVGQLLFFLLGEDRSRVSAGRYAFWTFIANRVGDVSLVAGALLLWRGYGSWQLPVLFARIAEHPGVQLGGVAILPLAGLLVASAGFVRSAQFPLHVWLPYTMDGPTPVSALMHAGIVNAGGFLLNRFAPLFVHVPLVLHLCFMVGLVTALVGSALMLTQNDVKKSLGYSTMGQMGFMIMECGVGAFSLAVYHLIAHGLFKATMFLNSGAAIGQARKHDGVPPDDIYTFVVEHRPVSGARLPWLLAALITVLVPLLMLGMSHWLVAADFFHRQGAVVLLFFGWVTGAQMFFSIYKLPSENPWRLMILLLLSMLVVVAGYTLVGHVFEEFLYPDAAMRDALYAAAGINLVAFDLMSVLLALVLVGAWLVIFYAQSLDLQGRRGSLWNAIYLNLYALFSRELYVVDVVARFARFMVRAATRLNLVLRWT
jgi:NADH-quinone oxidoreductase subunit L